MLTLNDGRSELWQWDTGRTLKVDAECSQVHFSNKVFGRSIDMPVIDGVAEIPDFLLQTDKELSAWAFVGTAENGYTKISRVFKVNKRNKPADYVFTPADQTTLEEIKEKLDYLESIQDPDAIRDAVNDYLEQNPVESPVQSVNGKIGKVELTAEDVGAISQDDLQEATNEALAQAKESGVFDGDDYVLTDDDKTEIAELAAGLVKVPEAPEISMQPLTFTGAVEATYDGSKPVEVVIPQGGGGESEWKYIGEFTTLENVNPLIINADSDGNPFACKEFRIQCLLCFFQLSTNTSANRSIHLIGDDGKKYDLSLNNVPTAIFPLTKAASLDGVAADIARNNVTLDITTHGNIIVCDMAADTLNYPGGNLNVNSIRNRGLNHTADKFKEIRVALGFPTNLLLAGSYLRVWGR